MKISLRKVSPPEFIFVATIEAKRGLMDPFSMPGNYLLKNFDLGTKYDLKYVILIR